MNLGPFEIVIILVAVLVIFGPKNLPKLGAAFGKTVKNVREGMEGDDEDKKDENVEDVVATDAPAAESTGETGEDTVFCTKCGTANPADSAFCKKCGAPLE